jgi:hypothetical protein
MGFWNGELHEYVITGQCCGLFAVFSEPAGGGHTELLKAFRLQPCRLNNRHHILNSTANPLCSCYGVLILSAIAIKPTLFVVLPGSVVILFSLASSLCMFSFFFVRCLPSFVFRCVIRSDSFGASVCDSWTRCPVFFAFLDSMFVGC